MPPATPARYAEILYAAKAGGYASPAVNVSASTTLNAAILGFVTAGSDGTVQVPRGGGDFAPAPIRTERSALGRSPTTPQPSPGASRSWSARTATTTRRPTSTASSAPCSPSRTSAADAVAHRSSSRRCSTDRILEVEIGAVGGEEDGVRGHGSNGRLYSTPEEALAVVDALGSGESGRYLLSATFRNVHGHYQPGKVALRPSILSGIQLAVTARHGERAVFDFVFHGGSGSTPDGIAEAISYGSSR